jgi:hypothetical protein
MAPSKRPSSSTTTTTGGFWWPPSRAPWTRPMPTPRSWSSTTDRPTIRGRSSPATATAFVQFSRPMAVRLPRSMPDSRPARTMSSAMLDSDDLFYPNKVERIARTFESYPEIRWVFHPVCREYEDGRRKPTPPLQRALYMDIREPALRGKLPGPPGPVTSGIVLSRTLLDRILPMPESIRITADNYLIFLAAALERGVYLDDVLALQCIHGSNNYTVRRDRTLTQARVLSFNYPQHATAIPCTVHSEQRHLLHSGTTSERSAEIRSASRPLRTMCRMSRFENCPISFYGPAIIG